MVSIEFGVQSFQLLPVVARGNGQDHFPELVGVQGSSVVFIKFIEQLLHLYLLSLDNPHYLINLCLYLWIGFVVYGAEHFLKLVMVDQIVVIPVAGLEYCIGFVGCNRGV